MKPAETYTIQQFINSNNGITLSYDSFCFLNRINDNQKIISFNVLNDYVDEISQMAVLVELDDTEYIKYKYKPKLLSYDVYGDTELYFIILYLNNIYSVKDFDFKKIKLLKKETLEFILSSIYNAEKKYIEEYNDKNGI